jgi:hypothetical protein
LSIVALPALAQVADPVPGTIPISHLFAEIEVVVDLPDVGPAHRPGARPMTLVGDGSGRRFIADQNGIVYQLYGDDSLSVFLDLAAATSLVTTSSQQGLTSIAFHPDYHSQGADGEGKFFTTSSQTSASGTPDYPVPVGAPLSHHGVLHEWTVSADPDAIDVASAREILRIGEPYKDHNLAQISFNTHVAQSHPDYGLLFVSVPDGGNVPRPRPTVDPHLVGQDLSHPLGSILRIDPLLPGGGGGAYASPSSNPFATDGDPNTLAEIWAYGLRNPHRFSWDPGGAGRMYISDIGQANIEEINLGASAANFGWSEREGTFLVVHDNEDDIFVLPPGDEILGFSYPVVQYDHDENDRAISGGYVVRSCTCDLAGEYIFGDLATGRVFHAPAASLDGSGQASFAALRLIDAADDTEKSLLEMIGGGTPAPRADLRFGRDDEGRIYLVTKRDGTVRALAPQPAMVPSASAWGRLVLSIAFVFIVLASGVLDRTSERAHSPPTHLRY